MTSATRPLVSNHRPASLPGLHALGVAIGGAASIGLWIAIIAAAVYVGQIPR